LTIIIESQPPALISSIKLNNLLIADHPDIMALLLIFYPTCI
jgi:hypothetical protein